MGSSKVVPIITTIMTGGLALGYYGAKNEMEKKKEGAQNAIKDEQNQINNQMDLQKKNDAATINQQQNTAGASQQAALAAIRAAMTASGSSGGTVLTGPQGASVAPTQSKKLLGV